jgi:hypothetical protein
MTTFTVHEPPPRKNEQVASPVRFAFVRDGFYFWAFLLGPVWMLYHRLWLVLLMYLAGTTAIQVALWALGVFGLVKFTVGSLRRWTSRGIVVAYNREAAEHRFFDRWSGNLPAADAPAAPPGARVPTSDRDIIGLFPEPQTRP